MSLKDLKSKSDKALASIPQTPPTGEQRPNRPVTAPGATAFMQPTIDALNERAKSAEARAAAAEHQIESHPTEVQLDLLDEVASRRRRLSEEQFDELKANLANNPLVHPVAIKRRSNGRFEIVSGHNRVAAFKALGRTHIPVVVVDIDEEKVDRSAFYANLLQPSLPDYEKYMGFRAEQERTGASQQALAEEAGVSKAMVSQLFSFESLPGQALATIRAKPECIGLRCAYELSRLAQTGKAQAVVEAVEMLALGKLTQKEAIRHASRNTVASSRPSPAAVSTVKIRAGSTAYCQYVSRGPSLRIEFQSEAQRMRAQEEVDRVLRTLAGDEG
jgi:ParB family transcriptional regulator, chromosome partitioning protein